MSLEPAKAHEQAVDDTCLVVFPACFFGRSDYLGCYDGTVGFGDFPFFEVAGDDLFDLVFETEGNFGDVFGRHCGFDDVVGIGRKDYTFPLEQP